jgi:Thioredoxin
MPEYNQLFQHFSNPKSKFYREDIVIAKIDGEVNSKIVATYGVHRFPTLIFFSPADTNLPIVYEYKQKFDDMVKFLDAHAVSTSNSYNKTSDISNEQCQRLIDEKVEKNNEYFKG